MHVHVHRDPHPGSSVLCLYQLVGQGGCLHALYTGQNPVWNVSKNACAPPSGGTDIIAEGCGLLHTMI
jgi:hypothetical protein